MNQEKTVRWLRTRSSSMATHLGKMDAVAKLQRHPPTRHWISHRHFYVLLAPITDRYDPYLFCRSYRMSHDIFP